MYIVTGASDGLGHELAKLLITQDKTVVDISNRQPRLAIAHIKTDITNDDEVLAAAREILALPEPIEAFINCAGVIGFEAFGNLSKLKVERMFHTNIIGPMLLTSRLAKRLKADGADIVNVSSTVGTKGYQDHGAYGASKWAMRGFSQNLQLELKGSPCRVISFCPGGFASNFYHNNNEDPIKDPHNWMRPEDLALFMLQILELPKIMEVSEVIINRNIR